MPLLTLKQAAAAVGKDPSTLTRAVQKGELSAASDPRTGARRFDPSELIRAFGPLVEAPTAAKPAALTEPAALLTEAELDRLREQVDELQARAAKLEEDKQREVADARSERDKWQANAEDWKRVAQEASDRWPKLLEDLRPKAPETPPEPVAPPPSSGILKWFRS